MKYKYLLLLLLVLPFVSGCERSDDVAGIFTGKTWKLTYITVADSKTPHPYNFWADNETYEKAIEETRQEDAYTITFSGMETDDVISGQLAGRLGGRTDFSGKWQADGKSNDFSASDIKSGGNKALLDSYFIEGIKNAKRYKGDYNTLYLYYTYKDKTELCLVFSVVK